MVNPLDLGGGSMGGISSNLMLDMQVQTMKSEIMATLHLMQSEISGEHRADAPRWCRISSPHVAIACLCERELPA